MSRGRMSRARAALSAGTITAGLLAGMAAAAPAASAASYPTCNSAKSVTVGSGTISQPYYTGTGSRNCILKHGTTSRGVEALQSALRKCHGHTSVAVDGLFGDKTLAALKKVQAAVDVTADGIYGPDTRKAMKWFWFTGDASTTGCKALGV